MAERTPYPDRGTARAPAAAAAPPQEESLYAEMLRYQNENNIEDEKDILGSKSRRNKNASRSKSPVPRAQSDSTPGSTEDRKPAGRSTPTSGRRKHTDSSSSSGRRSPTSSSDNRKKPGIVSVDQPAIHPNSAMYHAAYSTPVPTPAPTPSTSNNAGIVEARPLRLSGSGPVDPSANIRSRSPMRPPTQQNSGVIDALCVSAQNPQSRAPKVSPMNPLGGSKSRTPMVSPMDPLSGSQHNPMFFSSIDDTIQASHTKKTRSKSPMLDSLGLSSHTKSKNKAQRFPSTDNMDFEAASVTSKKSKSRSKSPKLFKTGRRKSVSDDAPASKSNKARRRGSVEDLPEMTQEEMAISTPDMPVFSAPSRRRRSIGTPTDTALPQNKPTPTQAYPARSDHSPTRGNFPIQKDGKRATPQPKPARPGIAGRAATTGSEHTSPPKDASPPRSWQRNDPSPPRSWQRNDPSPPRSWQRNASPSRDWKNTNASPNSSSHSRSAHSRSAHSRSAHSRSHHTRSQQPEQIGRATSDEVASSNNNSSRQQRRTSTSQLQMDADLMLALELSKQDAQQQESSTVAAAPAVTLKKPPSASPALSPKPPASTAARKPPPASHTLAPKPAPASTAARASPPKSSPIAFVRGPSPKSSPPKQPPSAAASASAAATAAAKKPAGLGDHFAKSSFAKDASKKVADDESSLADVLLALKLSAEEQAVRIRGGDKGGNSSSSRGGGGGVPLARQQSTSIKELLELEANDRRKNGGDNEDDSSSVMDLVAAGISAEDNSSSSSSSKNPIHNTNDPAKQHRLLERIREEEEQRQLEMALKASEEAIVTTTTAAAAATTTTTTTPPAPAPPPSSSSSSSSSSLLQQGDQVDADLKMALEVSRQESQNSSGGDGEVSPFDDDFVKEQQRAMEQFQQEKKKSNNNSNNSNNSNNISSNKAPSLAPLDHERGRNSLVERGTAETHQAIRIGKAHIIRCIGCKANLQAPVAYSLVFCPNCQTVSPTGM